MPVMPISLVARQGTLGSYYAISDYTRVNPEFGTLEDFKNVVRIAHHSGMKVIIDWVANHTGYDHVWTIEHPEYYKRNTHGQFYDEYGWVDVIDLDFTNKDVWGAMISAMGFWIRECNIDGFRCDMAHLVTIDFWREARSALDKDKKLFWLAECEVPYYHNVFDATYGWELLHKMEARYRGQATLSDLIAVLNKYENDFPANALRLLFTSNHDENSHSGSEFERFGNGAQVFAVLCATWKNSLPLVYSGQELPNYKKLKFFDKDQIDWNAGIHFDKFYQTLLILRNQKSNLFTSTSAATIIVTTDAPGHILAYSHKSSSDQLVVILNLSADKIRFHLSGNQISGRFTNQYEPGVAVDINEPTHFQLEAWDFLVFVKNET